MQDEILNNDVATENGNVDTQDEGAKSKTFTQEEVNELIKSNVARAIKKARKEAEKLSKMSDEERGNYENQQFIDSLNEREAAISKRELLADTKEELIRKNLPAELAETFILHSDKESAFNAIKGFEKVFNEAVSRAVKEKARQSTPTVSSSNAKTSNYGAELAKGAVSRNNKLI